MERAIVFKDKVTGDGEWNFEGETMVMWNYMATCIKQDAKEMLAESNEKGHYKLLEYRGSGSCLREKTSLQSLAGDQDYGKL